MFYHGQLLLFMKRFGDFYGQCFNIPVMGKPWPAKSETMSLEGLLKIPRASKTAL